MAAASTRPPDRSAPEPVREDVDPTLAAQAWLDRFDTAWRAGDPGRLERLLAVDSHWRDALAVTGELQTVSGRRDVAEALAGQPLTGPALHVAAGRTPPRQVVRAGAAVLEAIYSFQASAGPASGVIRLVSTPDDGLQAWTVLTSLDGLTAAPEKRHPELQPSRTFGGPNWAQRRRTKLDYTDADPAVLVVGAGHAGLGAAACLQRLGVDTLLIDRLPRVGDVWRQRYDALVLHNEVHVDHLPHLPFPLSAPRFLPRDTVADWLEAYANVMELGVWASTELTSATHDGTRWTVHVTRQGQRRTLRPRHLVMAVGTHADPRPAAAPGLSDFTGTVVHSSSYRSGQPYTGHNAIVLGTGSSAHDIAQDLHGYGARVTMVQRGPTLVVSLAEAQKAYPLHADGLPLADSDLLAAATPYPVLVRAHQILAAQARAADHDLLARLAARGFRLDDGSPDATGFQLKLLRRGGGYYVDVGCSELIASAQIGLVQHADTDRFVPDGLRMLDGTVVDADLVVTATGYLAPQDVVRRHLGDDIAQRVGRVGGLDEHGEQRNLGRPTAQPGLWFTGGGFPLARAHAKTLALQIASAELNQPPAPSNPTNASSRTAPTERRPHSTSTKEDPCATPTASS